MPFPNGWLLSALIDKGTSTEKAHKEGPHHIEILQNVVKTLKTGRPYNQFSTSIKFSNGSINMQYTSTMRSSVSPEKGRHSGDGCPMPQQRQMCGVRFTRGHSAQCATQRRATRH